MEKERDAVKRDVKNKRQQQKEMSRNGAII